MLAQLLEFIGQQSKPAEPIAGRKNDDQRRKYPLDAASVELGKAEITALQASENDAGDQEAGNNEEYVDTDEAAWQC